MVICSGASKRCEPCLHGIEHNYHPTCNNLYCVTFQLDVKCTETFEMIMKKIIKKHEEEEE
jgi:hypothetical protein